MDDMFHAKVLKIKPGTRMHNNEVIDQYVYVEMENGMLLNLFDYTCRVTNKMKGKLVKLAITLQTSTPPTIIQEKEYLMTQNHIKGQILELTTKKEKNEKNLNGIINAGAAKFSFISDYAPTIQKGVFIEYKSKHNFSFIITEAK